MTLQVPVFDGQNSASHLEVADEAFGQEFNETLVHQLVVRYLAGARAGTKAQKNRASVSGGGKKPWRQKGTGQARSGTTRSPLWRTGGVTFAASPRDFTQKLNKKMYKAGVRSIYSELLRQERLLVNDSIVPTSVKTKEFSKKLKDSGLDGKVLLIVDELTQELVLASRNLSNVTVSEVSSVTPLLLVAAEKVVVSSAAIKQIEERLL